MTFQSKPTKSTIYSRSGDLGETSLYKGPRVGKDHLRVDVIGGLDELNAWLGWVLAETPTCEVVAIIEKIQRRLFVIGCEISSLDPGQNFLRTVSENDVRVLERAIDYWSLRVSPTEHFVIPCGSRTSSALHVVRSICRRVERRAVALLRFDPKLSPRVIAWLNRLGDLFFLLARYECVHGNQSEVFLDMECAFKEFGDELIESETAREIDN